MIYIRVQLQKYGAMVPGNPPGTLEKYPAKLFAAHIYHGTPGSIKYTFVYPWYRQTPFQDQKSSSDISVFFQYQGQRFPAHTAFYLAPFPQLQEVAFGMTGYKLVIAILSFLSIMRVVNIYLSSNSFVCASIAIFTHIHDSFHRVP
jgi:hypothetical protein